MQSRSNGGIKIGSSKDNILDGVYFIRKSTAGYARNMPFGKIGYFLCINNPCNATAKLPPAESPAKTTFLGLTLKY